MTGPARRIRSRMTSGVVAMVPLVVTLYVLRALFGITAGILLPFIDPAVEDWPWLLRAGLSLSVLLIAIYLLGELTTNLVGRRILQWGEEALMRVPFVKVIYRASKQVVTAFQRPNSRAFKSVVLVEFPRQGMRSVGFLTSTFAGPDGATWHSVFVPTTPNPTTGFLQLLPDELVTHTRFTVEEAFKMVMSLGVLSPDGLPELLQSQSQDDLPVTPT